MKLQKDIIEVFRFFLNKCMLGNILSYKDSVAVYIGFHNGS